MTRRITPTPATTLSVTLAATLAAALALCLAGPAAAQEATLRVSDAGALGPHLIGPDGMPVYAFVTNGPGGDDLPPLESCKQKCLADWPLVTATGEVTVGEGLDPALVTVIDWEGQSVVQYDAQPLFGYAGDVAGAAPAGHDMHEHGGWWYLIGPDGAPIAEDTQLRERG